MAKCIPLTVPKEQESTFREHYEKITHGTDRFFLFAGDQKIEHLNADFSGPEIPDECSNPTHLFEIAAASPIGAFATQLGRIALYGHSYQDINYIVKMNSKTILISTNQAEPVSRALWSVEDIVQFKQQTKLSTFAFPSPSPNHG